MIFALTECPECSYHYSHLADLTDEEVDTLLFADIYDCETCNTLLPAWAARQKESTAMGDEKAAEYEALSNDWPKDREVGALDPEDQEPQETPADDGDKTSAIVFDDENVDGIPNDDDEVDLPADAEDDNDEEF